MSETKKEGLHHVYMKWQAAARFFTFALTQLLASHFPFAVNLRLNLHYHYKLKTGEPNEIERKYMYYRKATWLTINQLKCSHQTGTRLGVTILAL